MENRNSQELEGQRVGFGEADEQDQQPLEADKQIYGAVLHRPGFHDLGEPPASQALQSGNQVIPALKANADY
ncbi:MAG: hypothetical protein WKF97_26605 [Chitinophagaceae bacterium]